MGKPANAVTVPLAEYAPNTSCCQVADGVAR